MKNLVFKREVKEKLRQVEKKQEEYFIYIEKLNENNKEDNKYVIPKILA